MSLGPTMSGGTRIGVWGAVLALGVAAPVFFPAYLLQIATMWLFVVFALTWDLGGGQMGYNSFGNVVFVGVGMYACSVTQVGLFYSVGAYTAARGGGTEFVFTMPQYVTGLGVGLVVAGVVSVITALVLGSMVLGMRGHYFAICTLGLGVAAGELAASWEWIGAGAGMTAPEAPGWLDVNTFYYYFCFVLAVITFFAMRWILASRFGLAINAIRDDEDKAEAMGLPTTRLKVTAWMFSALFLGLAGGIYGNMTRFIDPNDTAFAGATIGVWMVLMAILGGKGTLWGPVIGAALFELIKEVTWTYLLDWQRVALGLLIVLIVVFFPQGILGYLRERFPALFGHTVEAEIAAEVEEAAS